MAFATPAQLTAYIPGIRLGSNNTLTDAALQARIESEEQYIRIEAVRLGYSAAIPSSPSGTRTNRDYILESLTLEPVASELILTVTPFVDPFWINTARQIEKHYLYSRSLYVTGKLYKVFTATLPVTSFCTIDDVTPYMPGYVKTDAQAVPSQTRIEELISRFSAIMHALCSYHGVASTTLSSTQTVIVKTLVKELTAVTALRTRGLRENNAFNTEAYYFAQNTYKGLDKFAARGFDL